MKASLEKDLEAAQGDGKSKKVKIDDLVAQLAKLNDSKEGVEKLLSQAGIRVAEALILEPSNDALGSPFLVVTRLPGKLEGALSFEIWFKSDAPLDVMRDAL